MQIWLARHGQTDLNLANCWQGRIDQPLNQTGRIQAQTMRKKLGNMTFDAVYASPLDRAVETASILGNVDRSQIRIDPRLIEADFGKYDATKYLRPGSLPLVFFWALPEILSQPKTVESIPDMIKRSQSFLRDLAEENYQNVLITCHGGIMRVLTGCLLGKKSQYVWRPKPHNCEVRVFTPDGSHYKMTKDLLLPGK